MLAKLITHTRKKSNSTPQLPTYSSASEANLASHFAQFSLKSFTENIDKIIEDSIKHSNVSIGRFLLEDDHCRSVLTKERVSKIFAGFYETELPIQMVQYQAIKDYLDYAYIQTFAKEDKALAQAMVASPFYIYQLAPVKVAELALWHPAQIPGLLKRIFASESEGGSLEIAWIRNCIDCLYQESLSSRLVLHTAPEYLQKAIELESTQISIDLLKSLFPTDRTLGLSILKSTYLLEKMGYNPNLAYTHQTFTAHDYHILATYYQFRGPEILASQYLQMANIADSFDLNLERHRTHFILWNLSNPAPFEALIEQSTLSGEPPNQVLKPNSPHL